MAIRPEFRNPLKPQQPTTVRANILRSADRQQAVWASDHRSAWK